MVVYIAGPMTGLPDCNRRSFMEAEERLKAKGHIVLNPAMHPDGLTHEKYMTMCLPMVEVADAVYLLDGWGNSKGAMIEYNYAKKLGKKLSSGDAWNLK